MADETKTLADVVTAVEGVGGAVETLETKLGTRIEALTEEVGEVKAKLDAQEDLALEVRRRADGQLALISAVTQLINVEARLARVEATVFPSKH